MVFVLQSAQLLSAQVISDPAANPPAASDPSAGAKDTAKPSRRPNVLIVLADDLGIDAVPCYGGQDHKMPNLDRFCAEGVRFTNCHANPYCTPSRSELLTGRYPFATDTAPVLFDIDAHKFYLDPHKHPSFPRQFQQAGYRTALAGKWQLAFLKQRDQVRDFGFDTYMCWQIISEENERTSRYYQPYFRRDGKIIADEIKGRYGPDVMCDYLIDFIKQPSDQPFLVYYTSTLPHYPWLPTPDSVDQTIPEKPLGDPKFFPDMVTYLDKQFGRLLATLEEQGIADETLVIFLADNGTDQRLRSKWNDQVVPGGKASTNDRGTRVPFVVRWPGKIKPGKIDDQLVELADMFPTLCDLCGVPQPTEAIHGKSFAARVLDGSAKLNKPWIHAEIAGARYLRSNEWMLFYRTGQVKQVQPYPIDPQVVELPALNDSQRAAIEQLQQDLQQLGP